MSRPITASVTSTYSGQLTGTGNAQVQGSNNEAVLGNKSIVTNKNKTNVTSNSNNKQTITNGKGGTINYITNQAASSSEAIGILDRIGNFLSTNVGGSGGGGSGGGGTTIASSSTPAQIAAQTTGTAIRWGAIALIGLVLGALGFVVFRKKKTA